MKLFGKACGMLAMTLLAGCNVSVDNSSLDNHVDAAADRFENIAEDAADAIENQADRLENGVHVNVDLGSGGNQAGENTH
jgi:hypothetical protein